MWEYGSDPHEYKQNFGLTEVCALPLGVAAVRSIIIRDFYVNLATRFLGKFGKSRKIEKNPSIKETGKEHKEFR